MKAIRLLYIGNKLSKHGKNQTGVEYTGRLLEKAFQVESCSDKLNSINRIFDSLAQIIRLRSKTDYCLLDVYSSSNFYASVIYISFLKFLKIKTISILRGGNLPERLIKNPGLSRFVFGNSHALISPSNYLKEKFDANGYNPLIIPNSIPIGNYPFKKRRDFKPRLLYVRAFHKVYNPEMAVELVHILEQKGVEVSLTMVGPDKDGSLKKCEEKRAKYGLEESIDFKGYMSKNDWIQLSQNFDFFINPTNFDNTPVSVMEAMALGLVVVSTNVGGIPYLLSHEKNGFLAPPDDPSEMANQILTALKNPGKLTEITVEARKKVEEFDEELVLQKWIELLKK